MGAPSCSAPVGVLVVIACITLLGNVALATAVSVLFLGWIGALVRRNDGGLWTGGLGEAMLMVLGVFTLRNVAAAALTVTLSQERCSSPVA